VAGSQLALYLQGAKANHGFGHLEYDERTGGMERKTVNNAQKLPETIKGLCCLQALQMKGQRTYL